MPLRCITPLFYCTITASVISLAFIELRLYAFLEWSGCDAIDFKRGQGIKRTDPRSGFVYFASEIFGTDNLDIKTDVVTAYLGINFLKTRPQFKINKNDIYYI